MTDDIREWLDEVASIAQQIDADRVAELRLHLRKIREGRGRLFILGLGGSAANAQHAAADFRKFAHIESYAVTDNMAGFTALVNDVSWEDAPTDWLMQSWLDSADGVLLLSVNGGTETLSKGLVVAARYAQLQGASVLAIVGREGGLVERYATVTLVVPCVNEAHRTPHSESFQAVLWHLLAFSLQQHVA